MMFATMVHAALRVTAEEGEPIDETHSWLLPETAEIIYGSISFVLVAVLFWKLGVPGMVAKGLRSRTDRIQAELEASAAAKRAANSEATDIRQAAGDIEAERTRLLAEADAQAVALLDEGRTRLDAEVAELETRAADEVAKTSSRSGDELRGEIARLSAAAAEHLVNDALDEATHQRLIEDFISNVGRTDAHAGASS